MAGDTTEMNAEERALWGDTAARVTAALAGARGARAGGGERRAGRRRAGQGAAAADGCLEDHRP